MERHGGMKVKIKFTDQPFGFRPEDNCYIRALRQHYDVEFSNNPDYIFYGVFGTEFLQYPDKVRIFLATEPVIPNFNDCDYAIGMIPLRFGGRYFRQMPMTNYGEDMYYNRLASERPCPTEAFDRKFCNFIYSNEKNGSGATLRIQFCKMLQQYRPVDSPGRVLNNMPSGGIAQRYYGRSMAGASDFNPDWAASKLQFLQNYKFTIAFENVSMAGWITEKLIHPLQAGSIPIYWGAPDVGELFNPKAFVYFGDYGNDMDKVIRRVQELDEDEQQYMEMLRQPVFTNGFRMNWENELSEFLCGIIQRGVRPFEKNPMGYQTMGATDYHMLCAAGKVGLRTILKKTGEGLSGWAQYKMQRNHKERIK